MTSSPAKATLLWIVAVALFMEQLDTTIVNTAVPAMAESLGATPLSLKAVVTSYILSLAVGIPVSGWMADRFGTRRVFATANDAAGGIPHIAPRDPNPNPQAAVRVSLCSDSEDRIYLTVLLKIYPASRMAASPRGDIKGVPRRIPRPPISSNFMLIQ